MFKFRATAYNFKKKQGAIESVEFDALTRQAAVHHPEVFRLHRAHTVKGSPGTAPDGCVGIKMVGQV